MFQPEKFSIKAKIIEAGSMSDFNDIYVMGKVFKYADVNTLLEFGAGNGGWAVVCKYIAEEKICETYHPLDNLHWHTNDQYFMKEKFQLDWYTNPQDIVDYCEREMECCVKFLELNVNSDTFTSQIQNLFPNNSLDAFRVDIQVNRWHVRHFIKTCLSENGLVFYDDVKFNAGFERCMTVAWLMQELDLYPVVFTNQEVVLCKNKDYSMYLQDKLKQELDESIFYFKNNHYTFTDEKSYQWISMVDHSILDKSN